MVGGKEVSGVEGGETHFNALNGRKWLKRSFPSVFWDEGSDIKVHINYSS